MPHVSTGIPCGKLQYVGVGMCVRVCGTSVTMHAWEIVCVILFLVYLCTYWEQRGAHRCVPHIHKRGMRATEARPCKRHAKPVAHCWRMSAEEGSFRSERRAGADSGAALIPCTTHASHHDFMLADVCHANVVHARASMDHAMKVARVWGHADAPVAVGSPPSTLSRVLAACRLLLAARCVKENVTHALYGSAALNTYIPPECHTTPNDIDVALDASGDNALVPLALLQWSCACLNAMFSASSARLCKVEPAQFHWELVACLGGHTVYTVVMRTRGVERRRVMDVTGMHKWTQHGQNVLWSPRADVLPHLQAACAAATFCTPAPSGAAQAGVQVTAHSDGRASVVLPCAKSLDPVVTVADKAAVQRMLAVCSALTPVAAVASEFLEQSCDSAVLHVFPLHTLAAGMKSMLRPQAGLPTERIAVVRDRLRVLRTLHAQRQLCYGGWALRQQWLHAVAGGIADEQPAEKGDGLVEALERQQGASTSQVIHRRACSPTAAVMVNSCCQTDHAGGNEQAPELAPPPCAACSTLSREVTALQDALCRTKDEVAALQEQLRESAAALQHVTDKAAQEKCKREKQQAAAEGRAKEASALDAAILDSMRHTLQQGQDAVRKGVTASLALQMDMEDMGPLNVDGRALSTAVGDTGVFEACVHVYAPFLHSPLQGSSAWKSVTRESCRGDKQRMTEAVLCVCNTAAMFSGQLFLVRWLSQVEPVMRRALRDAGDSPDAAQLHAALDYCDAAPDDRGDTPQFLGTSSVRPSASLAKVLGGIMCAVSEATSRSVAEIHRSGLEKLLGGAKAVNDALARFPHKDVPPRTPKSTRERGK